MLVKLPLRLKRERGAPLCLSKCLAQYIALQPHPHTVSITLTADTHSPGHRSRINPKDVIKHSRSYKMSFGDFRSHSHASPPPFQRTPTPFTPSKHSPLTPRRSPHSNEENYAPQSILQSPPQSPSPLLKFGEIKRKHKANPIMMSKEDVREKRRNIFLNKLRDAREQSRLQVRGGEDEVCL